MGSSDILSGAVAGLVTRTFLCPLDVIKIRYQTSPDLVGTSGIIKALQHIVRNEGAIGLWKGNVAGSLLYMTYGAVQFPTYHALKARLSSSTGLSSHSVAFLSGSAAGSLATVVTYPFDLIRTQVAILSRKQSLGLSWSTFLIDLKRGGMTGMWRGCSTSLLQVAPYMGVTFMTQEALKRPLHIMLPDYDRQLGNLRELVSGGLGGAIGKAFTMPFDVIRKRIQIHGLSHKETVFSALPSHATARVYPVFREILDKEGPAALFRGLHPAMIKSGLGAGLSFFMFRVMQQQQQRSQHENE